MKYLRSKRYRLATSTLYSAHHPRQPKWIKIKLFKFGIPKLIFNHILGTKSISYRKIKINWIVWVLYPPLYYYFCSLTLKWKIYIWSFKFSLGYILIFEILFSLQPIFLLFNCDNLILTFPSCYNFLLTWLIERQSKHFFFFLVLL